MALTQISTAGVKDNAVTSGKIPADAVGASELANDAVDTNAIVNGAVTNAKLASGIDASKITGLTTDAITENNSKVEVVDTGTGYVTTVIDGTEVSRAKASGSTIFTSAIFGANTDKTDGSGQGITLMYGGGTSNVGIIGCTHTSGLQIRNNAAIQLQQNGFPNNIYASFTNTGGSFSTSGTARFDYDGTNINFALNVLPDTDSNYDIGTSAKRFANVYADTLYGSGANITALNGSAISSGTVPVANIGTGTKNTSTFYRGDGTFATVTAPAITAINGAGNDRIITSDGGTTVTAEDSLTFDGNELKAILGSTHPKFTLKRSGNVDSADNIFAQVSAQDANGTVIGELTWRRESANDESYLDFETKTTGINNAQPSARIKGSNGTAYFVGNLGRTNNNQPAYMTDVDYYANTHLSTVNIQSRTNGGECGLYVRGRGQGGGSSSPHSCIRVDATSCGNNADQYGIYIKGRQQLVSDTTGYFADVYGSYSTTYCYRAHLQKQVGAYTNGYSYHSKITETSSGGSSYHFRGDDGTTQKVRIERDGDLDNANNSYGGLSDVKLKENIVDAGSQWEDIKAIKIRNYNFKASTGLSTHKQLGVVAQELETVSAGLIKNEKDVEIDEKTGEGKVTGTTKSVKYSVLYLKALKALQEAMARIEVLEAKVA